MGLSGIMAILFCGITMVRPRPILALILTPTLITGALHSHQPLASHADHYSAGRNPNTLTLSVIGDGLIVHIPTLAVVQDVCISLGDVRFCLSRTRGSPKPNWFFFAYLPTKIRIVLPLDC